jgi:acyl transferase domain-containing protein
MSQVPTTVQPWNAQALRRASVNNFGFGGSNTHVIIDDAPSYFKSHNMESSLEARRRNYGLSQSSSHDRARLFPLSAFEEAVGTRQAEILANYLRDKG